MARKMDQVLLMAALLISMFHGMSVADWTSDLTSSINQMVVNINHQVQSSIRHLGERIQQGVEDSIKHLPRDSTGQLIMNGNTVIVHGGNGYSRSIVTGRTLDGEPYVRDVEERYDGNFLYHDEINYNPIKNTTEKIRWKLDVKTPGAKPEILTDEN